MQGKFKVIALCGSSKFESEILQVQKDLTLQGYIVVPMVCFTQFDKRIDSCAAMINTEMRKEQIKMSDELFVVNPNGYIEYETQLEIQYAYKNGKLVKYLEPISTDIASIIMNSQNDETKDVLTIAFEHFNSISNTKCSTCNKRYACSEHNLLTCLEQGGIPLDEFIKQHRKT